MTTSPTSTTVRSSMGSSISPRPGRIVWAALAVCCATSSAPLAYAQSVRVTGASTVRFIELRPFLLDSVPESATTGSTLLRQLADGRVVRCIPGEAFCRDVHPGSTISTVPTTHDIDASVWGLGEGVRLFTQLRARTTWSSDRSFGGWPRADDALDVMAAYGEIDRDRWRLRLGRQWKVTGLGFYNFDGVTAAYRIGNALSLEGFGGRSLLRGLNEPRTSGALEAVEPFAPPSNGVLAGVQARYRPSNAFAASATYQLDVRGDRRTMFSELLVSNATWRIRNASVDGALEADLASNMINEARLFLRAPPVRQTALFAEARHYQPFFEQWTIWGAFSPASFDEARAGATWSTRNGRFIARGDGGYRSYNVPNADEGADRLRTSGWTVGSSLSWAPDTVWRIEGSFRADVGFGASGRNFQAGAIRQFGDRGTLALQGTWFERAYEFRLEEGAVAGAGADIAWMLSSRARVVSNVAFYRHLRRSDNIDWTQRRISLRMEWTLGAEPDFVPTRIAGGLR